MWPRQNVGLWLRYIGDDSALSPPPRRLANRINELARSKASVTAAANAVQKGVVVVCSSRVVTGVASRNVEVNDDELGFIASDELNPQKARFS